MPGVFLGLKGPWEPEVSLGLGISRGMVLALKLGHLWGQSCHWGLQCPWGWGAPGDQGVSVAGRVPGTGGVCLTPPTPMQTPSCQG